MTLVADKSAPVPPQDLEAEESILGAMMLSPGAIGAVSEILESSDFYRESHTKIYLAALRLYGRGEPVDAITVVAELSDTEGALAAVGGKKRIHELAALVPATANAGHYAKIVHEMAMLRGLIRVSSEISRLGWERPGTATDMLDLAEQAIFGLAEMRQTSEFVEMPELMHASHAQMTALFEAGSDMTGVPSGFRDLDKRTAGFQAGNLIILAARPSVGKTAMALGMAAHAALKRDIPVALYTLEMSKLEIAQRLIAAESLVESQKLRTGQLTAADWVEVTSACDRLSKAPIYVDDSATMTVLDIRSKARRLKARRPDLGLVVVDYLQLMTTGSTTENRTQEVSQITRQLKSLARDLALPVIALSQLTRKVEDRGDKRPMLSDLRESGSIEQDADIVLFIYRDDYYDEESDQAGIAEVHIAKHRNGPTDTIELSFRKETALFTGIARWRP